MTRHSTRRTVLAGLGLVPLIGAAAPDGPPPAILIRNVHLFDGTGGARQPRNVRITGDRIGNCALFARSGKRNPYRAARLGVIEQGAWADLLLARGNPLDDLRLLEDFERNLLVIIKDGVIHKNLMPA